MGAAASWNPIHQHLFYRALKLALDLSFPRQELPWPRHLSFYQMAFNNSLPFSSSSVFDFSTLPTSLFLLGFSEPPSSFSEAFSIALKMPRAK